MKKFWFKKFNSGSENGLTIVEMIVALFAFSIVLTIIGSAFVHVLVSQRRAINAQKVEENLTYIIEAMTREIRVAQPPAGQSNFTDFFANTSCPSLPANSFSFRNSTGQNIVYALSGSSIHRCVNGTDSIMNSNDVQFTQLQFRVSNLVYGIQPRVTITTTLQSTETVQQIREDFQTTVSVRFLEI